MLPLLGEGSLERALPLYWRCRVAGGGLKVAMRVGDWKILAPENLSRFELYDIAGDCFVADGALP